MLAATIQAFVPMHVKPIWALPDVQAHAIGAAAEEWALDVPASKRNKLIAAALENAPAVTFWSLLFLIFGPRVQQTAMIMAGNMPPPAFRPPRRPPPGAGPQQGPPIARPRPPAGPTREDIQERLRAAAAAAAAEGRAFDAAEFTAPAPERDYTQDGGGFPSAYDDEEDEQVADELRAGGPTDGPQVRVQSGWRPRE